MNDDPLQTFVRERVRLVSVAYAVLGDVAEAEDVVQDAWLRLQRTDADTIDDVTGWLVVTVARLALDVARSARRRREAYVGPWLPEPLTVGPTRHGDPQHAVLLGEEVHLAVLAVLESLSPAERAVFVLHDIFGVPFDEVATAVARTPAACRQLASRAHVQARTPRFEPDKAEQHKILEAFTRACDDGDLAALTALLDPDVVLRSDGGGKVRAALRPVVGADRVARLLLGVRTRRVMQTRAVLVNGWPGLLSLSEDGALTLTSPIISAGRIVALDLQRNPDKLTRVSVGVDERHQS